MITWLGYMTFGNISFWYAFLLSLMIAAFEKFAIRHFNLSPDHIAKVHFANRLGTITSFPSEFGSHIFWFNNIEIWYYKKRKLLQNETENSFSEVITKCVSYYKMWQVIITKRVRYSYKVWQTVITKRVRYYKAWQTVIDKFDIYYVVKRNTCA